MSSDPHFPTVRDVPSKGSIGCFGAILGLVVVGVWYTLVPKNNVHGIIPLTAASLVLLAIALIAGWRNHASRYRAILYTGAILLALGSFVGFSAEFARNFIDNGCDSFPNDGTFIHDLIVSFFDRLRTAFALVCSGTVGFLLARVLVQRRSRWLEPALYTASRCAFGGMVCLLLAVAPRAFLLPFPNRYVESLPIVATIQLDALKEPTRVEVEGEDMKLDIFDVPVADFIVRSVCAHDRRSQCVITVGQPMLELARNRRGGRSYRESLGLVGTTWERAPLCDPDKEFTVERTSVVIREDRARGLVFIDGDAPSHGRIRRAARLSSGIDNVTFRDIADSTSPPQSRLAAALAGFALAGWFLHRRRRNARRHAELVAAHAAFLGENGWIEFDHGTNLPLIRVSQDDGLVPGPVLVLPRQPNRVPQSPYRGEMVGGQGEIICGYRVELLAPVEDEMLIHSSLALAVLVLTAMPLLAAIDLWFLR